MIKIARKDKRLNFEFSLLFYDIYNFVYLSDISDIFVN